MILSKNSKKYKAVLKLMNENAAYNNAVVKALKNVRETQWVGNLTFRTMHECLTFLNLYSGMNSGFYDPIAIKINGLTGWFMVNQDGTIFLEARIIKESEDKYKIEYMAKEAWNQFENDLRSFLGE
jgi:hypothetical protein